MWFELRPLESILCSLLEAIKMKDVNDVFGQPVNTKEVPDYLEIVSHPMDFSTMQVIHLISSYLKKKLMLYVTYTNYNLYFTRSK